MSPLATDNLSSWLLFAVMNHVKNSCQLRWQASIHHADAAQTSPRRPARNLFSILCMLGASACLSPANTAAASDAPPNIVLILADDLGWSDLGCYGNPLFESPNLDRLAEEGLLLTQGYSPAPICSASRAGILTGKSPARLGFEFVTKDKPGSQLIEAPLQTPPYTLDLPLPEVTIAEVLGSAGYQTAFFGKWHLNRHHKRYLGWSPTHGPRAQGFEIAEEDFGCHPYSYWHEKSQRDFVELPAGAFPVDSMTQRVTRFLHSPHEKRFFLMVSHFFVHTPVHTQLAWLHKRYRDKIPASHPRRDAVAHYGAMVTTLDHLVGEVLTALDESGLTESTLVVFTSDNGGHPEYAGNAPLRGSKWNLYEGGIRVPFIIRWPGKVAPQTVSDEVVSGIDLLPTFAAIAQVDPPANIDGSSLASFVRDPTVRLGKRRLLWHFPYYHPEQHFLRAPESIGTDDGFTSQTRPQAALRVGSWKLLHFFEDNRDELYDLSADLTEHHSRHQAAEAIAQDLRGTLDEMLQATKARLPKEKKRE